MRLVIQRVTEAAVHIGGVCAGSTGPGLMILAGIEEADTEEDVRWLAKKAADMRIFSDAEGKMNLSVKEMGGSALVVSQFTLYADCKKGNRPSFVKAGAPDMAEHLYEHFMERCRNYVDVVEKGQFGADMKVELLNDGPFTLMLESEQLFK